MTHCQHYVCCSRVKRVPSKVHALLSDPDTVGSQAVTTSGRKPVFPAKQPYSAVRG